MNVYDGADTVAKRLKSFKKADKKNIVANLFLTDNMPFHISTVYVNVCVYVQADAGFLWWCRDLSEVGGFDRTAAAGLDLHFDVNHSGT